MSNSLLWPEYIERLDAGLDLEPAEIQSVLQSILEDSADIESVKRFLLSLHKKGETAEEVSALVEQLYRNAKPLNISERAVDTVGTGGDGAHTINISSTAAIVAAAAGARVVKHGSRAVSSKSGASDFYGALGVAYDLGPAGVEQTVRELGIGFCFAPVFHPAMKNAAPARKELGVPTVFNFLGPLANPAKPKAAAIGVANDRIHLVMAQVMAAKGCDGFVFRGDDGLDEITLDGATSVLSIGREEISSDRIDAKDFGLDNAPVSAVVGGDGAENAAIARRILAGERGAPRDIVLLNTAVTIAAFDGELDLSLHERIAKSLPRAINAIDSGAATSLLEKWAALSTEISSAQ
ncbi:MAG: anthranilate phosphoribosyltransferase [Candidatus Planktophila sp.]|nr:anthranilate phosphoribosyltransferase [Candidatus Planktophila sp.]